jgi:hypothetical protein
MFLMVKVPEILLGTFPWLGFNGLRHARRGVPNVVRLRGCAVRTYVRAWAKFCVRLPYLTLPGACWYLVHVYAAYAAGPRGCGVVDA